jgi:alpha-amylase/alpha-mannosidase (GH57 family)
LRDSLDWLRDQLVGPFEAVGSDLFPDPWAARDGYIEVVLGGPRGGFLERHARPGLSEEEQRTAIGLLEIQHRSMLMYTSCGWFFDDISGLEAVFVLRHAGRVAQLAREVLRLDLETEFLARLEAARSNLDGMTGRDVYHREVTPFL